MNEKHIAIYVRDKHTTDSQESELRQWLQGTACNEQVVWYRDLAPAGSRILPSWQRLEGELRRRRIKTILVSNIGVLGRTVAQLSKLLDKLVAADVNLISLKEQFDLMTPAGRVAINGLASLALGETEIRGAEIKEGHRMAKAAGKRWGGSVKGERVFKVKPEMITTIRGLIGTGQSVRHVAEAVGLSRPWIYEIIRRHEIPFNFVKPRRQEKRSPARASATPEKTRPREPRTLEELQRRCKANPTSIFFRILKQYRRNSEK